MDCWLYEYSYCSGTRTCSRRVNVSSTNFYLARFCLFNVVLFVPVTSQNQDLPLSLIHPKINVWRRIQQGRVEWVVRWITDGLFKRKWTNCCYLLKICFQVLYHSDFEKSKGKFTTVADDPETLRLMQNASTVSNIGYHGMLDHKNQMEATRQNYQDGQDPSQQQQSYVAPYQSSQPTEEPRSTIEYQPAATPSQWKKGFPPNQPPRKSPSLFIIFSIVTYIFVDCEVGDCMQLVCKHVKKAWKFFPVRPTNVRRP